MRTLLAVIAIIVVILVIVVVTQKYSTPKNNNATSQTNLKTTSLTVGKYKFTLEIAKTAADQQIGLSGRDSLSTDHGMVFPFSQPGFYGFWMRKMQFPIDIIYLNDKHIVSIFENVKNPTFPIDNPPVYKPDIPADIVVELTAGSAKKLNLKKGDTLNLSL